MSSEGAWVVYFDGRCGLCSRFVDFAVRHDRRRRLRFASLQGLTATEHLAFAGQDTVVLQIGTATFDRSTAVLMTVAALGGPWRLASLLRWIPRPVRDAAYDLVARNRYHWFGQRISCRMPRPEEESWFLP
jgi:predicted DCC family thiol-disulfide oxidoreductase YuxK